MIYRNLWQLLLSGLCCLALVVFTACDAQGPNKKSDNANASSKTENSDNSADASSTTDADDDADMDDSSANGASEDAMIDDHDHDGDDHDHDHDGDDHDHDGHDHDHDGHDHDDDSGMTDEQTSLSASPNDFIMNLDGMPTDRLVDPAEVLDTAALGIPIRASGVKSTTPKQAYEDLIYGNIRIRMDTSIALRRAMLEKGVAPTDPGVRNLEGQILKAKDLLEQAGESVAPIEPPIQ